MYTYIYKIQICICIKLLTRKQNVNHKMDIKFCFIKLKPRKDLEIVSIRLRIYLKQLLIKDLCIKILCVPLFFFSGLNLKSTFDNQPLDCSSYVYVNEISPWLRISMD